MNIYNENDYRKILELAVAVRKKVDAAVNFQRMAAHMKVPKSYVSRVIRGKADLSPDQLHLACEFLGFGEAENTYIQILLQLARTSVKTRRENLLREIKEIQSRYLDTKSHLKAEVVGPLNASDMIEYYLDPLIQLIHICLSIPRYQKDQALLARGVGIQTPKLLAIIDKLEQWQLISRGVDGIRLRVENIHLPKDSPVYRTWRTELKLRAIQRLNEVADESAYSFAVVFSANESIRKEIKSRFLSFLRDVEELVGKGPQEEVYQMGFDLFPWT